MTDRQLIRYGVAAMFLAALGWVVEVWAWAVLDFSYQVGWAWGVSNLFAFIVGAVVAITGQERKERNR